MSFWSASCFPQTSHSALFFGRINVNWQEVLGAFIEENKLTCAFQVRRSIIDKKHQPWPATVRFANFAYAAGGADQIRLIVQETRPGDILEVIRDPIFRGAAKDFNLNFMRKGATNFARHHCFDLADAILSEPSAAASSSTFKPKQVRPPKMIPIRPHPRPR
ncbi:MAG: hypothetical protein ACLPSF_01115 [Methylocella sp.]